MESAVVGVHYAVVNGQKTTVPAAWNIIHECLSYYYYEGRHERPPLPGGTLETFFQSENLNSCDQVAYI